MEVLESVCLIMFLTSASVSAQFESNCAILQEDEVGETSSLSSKGLLVEALLVQSGETNITVQLLESNIVCLAQGPVRGIYRSTSLIVRYRDSGDVESTMQLHLQCVDGSWSVANFGNDETAVTPAGGNLTTPLRKDCLLCLDPSFTSGISAEEHCLACAPVCVGLRRCFGEAVLSQICCNFFDLTGSCVTECPENSSPNEAFECECVAGFASSEGGECVAESGCALNPCENGATCVNSSCVCPAGYTGDTCGTDINDCVSNPCENRGTCSDGVNGFSCQCLENWIGPFCETCALSTCADCALQSDSNETVCSQCAAGYSLSNGLCTISKECDVQVCALCSDDGVRCVSCLDEHTLSEDLQCVRSTPSDTTSIIIGVVIAVLLILLLLIILAIVILLLVCWQKHYTTYTVSRNKIEEAGEEKYTTL